MYQSAVDIGGRIARDLLGFPTMASPAQEAAAGWGAQESTD
jgi:hypothetical protein